MSQWTHVCGCIRVDALRVVMADDNHVETIKKALGRVITFEDLLEAARANRNTTTIIPCGSEGSLRYEIMENPNPSDISAYVVSIWGDLRDYDDDKAIEEWFNRACDQLWIRQAVLAIEVEGRPQRLISYLGEGL